MKIDGLNHPKTGELAVALGIPIYAAVGLLEFLWFFVGQQTPRGNVGKWSNGVIASNAKWDGNADDFIDALVQTGFLDPHHEHRLIVHDWQDHAPSWVFRKLQKLDAKIVSPDLSQDLDQPHKTKTKPSEDQDEDASACFEDAWAKYPKRAGGNPKRGAIAAWSARLKEGADPQDLIAGVERYAAYCESVGIVGSQFVKQTKTFFGPERHYTEDWTPPVGGKHETGRRLSAYERVEQQAIHNAEQETR